MKRNLILLLSILMILASCAKPTVIDISMPKDKQLNCNELSDEFYETRRFKKEAENTKEITSGGIIGTVERVMEDDRIEVLIGENTKVQIIRSTITSLLKKEEIKK